MLFVMRWGVNLMNKIVMSGVILTSLFFMGCHSSEIDWKGMAEGERLANIETRKTKIRYMPVEALYPDKLLRQLAIAAADGDIQTIDMLVQQGVNVNSTGYHNVSPLFWAMQNIDGYRRLLELGADPNIIFDTMSVMHLAASARISEYLSLALTYGGDPNLKAGRLKKTPIFSAVMSPTSIGNISLLLDAGADINAQTDGKLSGLDFSGTTAIMEAVSMNKFSLVYDLLQKGANYKIKNISNYGLTDRLIKKKKILNINTQEMEWLLKVEAWLLEQELQAVPLDN